MRLSPEPANKTVWTACPLRGIFGQLADSHLDIVKQLCYVVGKGLNRTPNLTVTMLTFQHIEGIAMSTVLSRLLVDSFVAKLESTLCKGLMETVSRER
ncbi:hypothetical protein PHET_01377 [Paragonimus heterotremus]|uniref:Uncharacterized protein n=1 Tax=Paragonimus heterotremus TaxID=100268 RepID=A0A8J4T3B7_9TREM|nr:hypothetical protein PHET_01377 [Paragonimus heterotremus]